MEINTADKDIGRYISESAELYLAPDGKIQAYSLILLNGIALRNLKSTALKAGDVLHIFPPAIGG